MVLSPLMLVTAIAIKSDGGPALYKTGAADEEWTEIQDF